MSLARRLPEIWYGPRSPGLTLRALARLYAIATGLHRALYRHGLRRVWRLPVPVLVVGNRVAGGTGKTPLVLALIAHLQARGKRPGVISRGYGRRGKDLLRVDPDTPPGLAGDEPALIACRSGAPVAVCADRVAAARLLLAEGCDTIIADDGLQHPRLGRDLEIEVIDASRGYGNGRLLPAGPLRERPPARFEGLRVVNGGDGGSGAGEGRDWPMRLRAGTPYRLADGRRRPLADFLAEPVAAVAGIGHPQRFFAALSEAGLRLHARAFPDHHPYRGEDLAFARERVLLMTEKDAVKCRGIAPPETYVVPVEAELPPAFFRAVDERLFRSGG